MSNNTGILDTCTWLWLTESEQATPVDSIKDVVQSSMKIPEFFTDEVWRTYRLKHHGNNNKDEDNSPKILKDKNQQASSQKFRQLILQPIVLQIIYVYLFKYLFKYVQTNDLC